MKLPAELKSEINRFAHNAGIAHGELIKRKLLAEVERRLTAGESVKLYDLMQTNTGAACKCLNNKDFIDLRLSHAQIIFA